MATDVKQLEEMINTLPRGEYLLEAPETLAVYKIKIYRDSEKLNLLCYNYVSMGFDAVEALKDGLAFVRDLPIGRFTIGILRAGEYISWRIIPIPEEAQA